MQTLPRTYSGPRSLPLQPEPSCHGGAGTILSTRLLTRGDFTSLVDWVDYVELPPATSIGVHLQDEDEMYLIASGRGRMTVDAAAYDVGPGDAVITRVGSTHSLANTGEAPLVMFVVQVAHE
jgi:mannose-6-phosphate isomerase-like protein (cupin superfamily)